MSRKTLQSIIYIIATTFVIAGTILIFSPAFKYGKTLIWLGLIIGSIGIFLKAIAPKKESEA